MKLPEEITWELKLNRLVSIVRDRLVRSLPFLIRSSPLRTVAIETTTKCTRKCPYCPPHSAMDIPHLYMRPELYDRILGSLSGHGFKGEIFFNLYGESLCDDRLGSWIEQARAALPGAKLVVFTNGDLLTVEKYRGLVKAGLDTMTISQHSPVLAPGLEKTLDTLRRDFAGIYRAKIINYHHHFHEGKNSLGLLNNKGGLADVRRKGVKCCTDISYIAVDCLGEVLLCCNDCTASYVFGNVMARDLYEIWEDPDFTAIRLEIMRGGAPFEICRKCMGPNGLCTAVPPGNAERLPPAFTDFDEVMRCRGMKERTGSRVLKPEARDL